MHATFTPPVMQLWTNPQRLWLCSVTTHWTGCSQPGSDPHSRPEMAASPSAPTSKARLYALLAALAGYAAVGWCVLAIVKAVVGDPLTNYLLSTHNNAMLVVSSAAHCPPTTRAYTKLF